MPSSHLLYPELIKESEEELLQLEKRQQLSYVKDRVRFIRYLKESIAKSQA